ncbi:MAG: hypothetical protein IJ111_13425 [Eggerthellaceae bacterium]|nr:hypothetical protein [Eggerthellaceae bacterium]
MVVEDMVQQAFYNGSAAGDVTFGDVLMLVEDDAGIDDVAERFEGADLLPDYLSGHARALISIHGAFGKGAKAAYLRYSELLEQRNARDWRERDLETLRMLVREAFSLFELLQNEEEHPVTVAVLDVHGVKRSKPKADGRIDLTASYLLPACDYLQFLSNGCDSLSARPFLCDCRVEPLEEGEGRDAVIGWAANKGGARMSFTVHDVPDNARGYRSFMGYLLKFLLDVHLHDVQLVTYDGGKQLCVAKHAVAAVWVCLREELSGARAGVCRVCGKPFIASNERKEKARYCQQGGTCAKAFARARKVLEAVNDGADLEDALGGIGKISRRKLADIASRNYYVLSLEFPNVDMETLERKGGEAKKN